MPTICHQEDDRIEWNRSSGYYKRHHSLEIYDYRPGLPSDTNNPREHYPPVGLPELFSLLGRAARHLLDAVCSSLDLRSFCFADFLDNAPLKSGEVSSSVLSINCHARSEVPGHFPRSPNTQSTEFSTSHYDTNIEKGLLMLMKSDKPGLRIRDEHGRWILADMDLGPLDMVMCSGLALYHCTAGYINPSLYTFSIDADNVGRCSLSFKLMPRALAVLHCSAMVAAGYGVIGPFQQPLSVCDFMQHAFQSDRTNISRSMISVYPGQQSDGALKVMAKHPRQMSKIKPLAPSKRLRLEAQRVLKEKVQEIADSKGIKIRFCSLKDCEDHHILCEESPCASIRAQIGWPAGVPFVHPHDLPNKSKQAFLEAYEPSSTVLQLGENSSEQ
ncbi:hypothetical protein KP509_1Z102800 [Ceratopteris richardii]|nr:hypothetical protein KP509_1Z102800 [Ceratopteris richardii]